MSIARLMASRRRLRSGGQTANGWSAVLLAVSVAVCGGCGGSKSGGGGGAGAASGAPTWAKSFGGPARDQAAAGAALADGGYAFAGLWNNRGAGGIPFGISGEGFEGDAWLVNLDAYGDIRWQRSYGLRSVIPDGGEQPYYSVVRPAADDDGSVWLVGRVWSVGEQSDGGEYQEPGFDLIITRIGADDSVLWSRSYDSSPFPFRPYFFPDQQTSEKVTSDEADVWPTADGGAVVAATVEAFVLDGTRGETARAVWVLAVDAEGDIQWSSFLGADELVGFEDSLGYGFSYGTPRGTGPYNVRVRALPNGGAVVAYGTSPTADSGRTDVVWLDAGLGAGGVRWRARFDDDDFVADLRIAEDAGGAVLGVLLAGITDVDDGLGIAEQGVVRLLAPEDGRELWRRDFGNFDSADDTSPLAVGLAREACGAGICRYAVLLEDGNDTAVRLLDGNSGDVLESIDLPGNFAHSIRALPDLRLQVVTRRVAPATGMLLRVYERSATDASLTLLEQRVIATAGSVPDAGSGFLSIGSAHHEAAAQNLVRWDDHGNATGGLSLGGHEDVRLERASAMLVLRNSTGTDDVGYLIAGEMVGTLDGFSFDRNAWLLGLDAQGTITWQERLDGFALWNTRVVQDERLPSGYYSQPRDLLSAAPDGGYLLGGHTRADGAGRVLKLAADGSLQWISPPLSPRIDPDEVQLGINVRVVRSTPDGGAFAAGAPVSPPPWVARLDDQGGLLWLQESDGFSISDLHPAADGGALLAGSKEDGAGIAAVRLDGDGQLLWARAYRFGRALVAENVRIAPSVEGWVLAATVGEDDVHVELEGEEDERFVEYGRNNILLFEIADSAGNDTERGPGQVRWGRLYGALYDEVVHGLTALPDGGLLVTGQSDSLGDYTEAWVLRLGADGSVVAGCNAELGRAIPVEIDLPAAFVPYAPAEDTLAGEPFAGITAVPTNVLVEVPSDVVVARQCAGAAASTPPLFVETHSLTVNQAGTLTGVVTSSPPGIACGTAAGEALCSAVYEAGTLVTLRVDLGSVDDFERWGDGCAEVTGNFGELCTVRVDADRAIDVFFGEELPPEPTPPVASFTAAPASVMLGGTIAFDAGASSDADGTIVDYAWDFTSDGTIDESGVVASWTPDAPGTFTVALEVTDDDGLTDRTTFDVTVDTGGSPNFYTLTLTFAGPGAAGGRVDIAPLSLALVPGSPSCSGNECVVRDLTDTITLTPSTTNNFAFFDVWQPVNVCTRLVGTDCEIDLAGDVEITAVFGTE